MKILFVSNLFPDTTEPVRGLFNARIVKHLQARAEVRVVAPRGTWKWGVAPRRSRPDDEPARPIFPRVWYMPKIGSRVNHLLMAEGLKSTLEEVRREFRYDVILASWIYPDACGVARIAKQMGVPFVAVAQGSDVHQYLSIPARRRIIVDALQNAGGVVTRSEELRRLLVEAGVDGKKIVVIYNGVDCDVFHPGDRGDARQTLGWPTNDEVVLYVGNLVPVKNPRLLVEAFAGVDRPNARLVIAGDGELRDSLRAIAGPRISFVGRKPEREIATMMRAANLLCVPSDNEGVPNVILEALASGLRVVATRVGGIPEIVDRELLGTLVERGDGKRLSVAISSSLAAPDRAGEIAAHATKYSWAATTDAYAEVLRNVQGA
jgi:glycosyltransferase involved in cell wall biosynthesis